MPVEEPPDQEVGLFSRSEGPILRPAPDVPWASGAVFNPGAWFDGRRVHLLVRAVPKGYQPLASRDGAFAGYSNYVSSIGHATSDDGYVFQLRNEPVIEPDSPFDAFGAEDPRISRLDGTYLVTYTALSTPAFGPGTGIRVALASTEDFVSFRKHGVVGPAFVDKNAVIFPRRVGGRIAMLHRIEPNIQIAYFEDLEELYNPPADFWPRRLARLDSDTILRPAEDWEALKIGAGPTPIETEEGWLVLYHGVDGRCVYRAGLALLDLEDPRRVLARSRMPVLEPKMPYEKAGDVNNVVFPEGAVVIGDGLHLYYGAADRVVGHAEASLADVRSYLKEHTV